MTDAMFTFAWYALALGAATGRFPKAGRAVRWSAARRATSFIRPKTARSSPAARIEQKFWLAFTQAIGLPAELIDDLRDPRATRDAVAKLIVARTSDEWRPIFAAADCCATIVVPLQEAMRDPHFVERGLFAHTIESAAGKTIAGAAVADCAGISRQPGAKKAPKLDES